jgi:hypothetical protein
VKQESAFKKVPSLEFKFEFWREKRCERSGNQTLVVMIDFTSPTGTKLKLVLSRPEGCHIICVVFSFFGGIQCHVMSITTRNYGTKTSLFLLRFWEVSHAVFWPYCCWPSLQNLTLRLSLFKDKTYFKKVIYWEWFKFILSPISKSKICPWPPIASVKTWALCRILWEHAKYSTQNTASSLSLTERVFVHEKFWSKCIGILTRHRLGGVVHVT